MQINQEEHLVNMIETCLKQEKPKNKLEPSITFTQSDNLMCALDEPLYITLELMTNPHVGSSLIRYA